MLSRTTLVTFTVLVVVRQLVTLVHGIAHEMLSIPMAPWQHVFIYLVIVIGPLVALAVMWWWRTRVSAWLLLAVVAAGAVFGLYYHFGPVNPDHVTALPHEAGRMLFIVTAVVLAAVEIACVGVGVWRLRLENSRTLVTSHGG